MPASDQKGGTFGTKNQDFEFVDVFFSQTVHIYSIVVICLYKLISGAVPDIIDL